MNKIHIIKLIQDELDMTRQEAEAAVESAN